MKEKLVLGKDYDGWCLRYHSGMWCTGSFKRTRTDVIKHSGWYGEQARRGILGKLVKVKLVEVE